MTATNAASLLQHSKTVASLSLDKSSEGMECDINTDTIDFKYFRKSKDFLFSKHNKEVFEKQIIKVGCKKIRQIKDELDIIKGQKQLV